MNVMEIVNSLDAFYFPGCHTVVAAIAGLRWPVPGASIECSDEEPPLLPVHGEGAGIVIDGYLGMYLSTEQRIVIYKNAITETAARLGIHPQHLRIIVELHEYAHAILHVGIDERGEQCSLDTYGSIVDEIHESLAQLIAARAIAKHVVETTDERARAVWQRLQAVEFPALESCLTDDYRLWREFDHLSPERLQRVLLALRRATPLNQWSGFTLLR